MKFIKSKSTLLYAALTLSTIGYSSSSFALIPTTDAANLTENIAGNIASAYSWAEQKAIMMADLDLQSMLSELGIDNDNNAISNMIVRSGSALEEIQNIEIIEQSIPDKDATSTISLQAMKSTAQCSAQSEAETDMDDHVEENCQFMTDVADQIELRQDIVDDFIEECESLIDTDNLGDDEEPINKTLCVRSSILVGAGTLDTYTYDQASAVKQFVRLVTGVRPTLKQSGKHSEDSAVLINEMRKEAVKGLAFSSLNEIALMRTSSTTSGTSPLMAPLHIISDFDEDRFGSTSWMATLQNVDEDNKNSVYPSEVLRKVAVMDSFLVHMSVLSYKQQLRMEALEATGLAIKINPVD
ncbi:hypothetical protein [Psychromonas sp. SP041]|uniref:hypothetical protein n=1 Tax=Psychromonas sp. SP041 TaxID=1365007 RepID=UPI0010C7968C|nr:hypothetical protein [Psychromonas sp. SP041]